MSPKISAYSFTSSLGLMRYEWDDELCHRIDLLDEAVALPSHDDPVSRWLAAYVQAKALPLPNLAGPKTPFQARMREALLKIPVGEVLSYGALAKQLNTSPRALGQALGANPLPIMIPCHRIVGASGLGGYHYGSAWKGCLLQHESQPR